MTWFKWQTLSMLLLNPPILEYIPSLIILQKKPTMPIGQSQSFLKSTCRELVHFKLKSTYHRIPRRDSISRPIARLLGGRRRPRRQGIRTRDSHKSITKIVNYLWNNSE
jgi:hypothetical protein